MSEIDLLIALLIAISIVISAFRGFFKEAVSLSTWVAAILITLVYTSRFASLLPRDSIESLEARLSISAVVLFFGTLIVGGLVNYLLQKVLAGAGKGRLDLFLGIGFGFARGLLIAVLLVLMANLIPNFKQENWWRHSALLPYLQYAAKAVHGQLPTELAQHFDFTSARS